MKTDKSVAIYCNKNYPELLESLKQKYTNIICLYDNIVSKNIYNLPRFHYTEINNLGYDIIIDDLSLYERLQNKNNKIIYYMPDGSNHNINYKLLSSFMQQIDAVIVPEKISDKFMTIVFNYTKELIHV